MEKEHVLSKQQLNVRPPVLNLEVQGWLWSLGAAELSMDPFA